MKKVFISMTAIAVSMSVTAQVKPTTTKPVVKSTTKVQPTVAKQSAAAAGIRSSLDSLAYAIGVNISGSLQQQDLAKINTTLLQKGINDGLKSKPVIDPQVCNNTIQTYMQTLQQKLQASAMEKVGGEKTKATAFLEANKKKPGVIALADGLQYEIIKKGDESGPMPKAADTFVAHYAGTLIDGTKFDNSYDRGEPLTLPVTGVIKGWTEILQMMHVGDKWRVFIPSDLAYGDRGAGGGQIPGGAALIFEMELLGVKPAVAH